MMSLETIQSMTQDNRKKAAKKSLKPYMVEAEDIEAWKEGRCMPLPFPNIGDYEPPGFKPDGDPLFVDSSGFGGEGEAALTLAGMLDALEVGKGYALVSEGQFQVYVQAFVPTVPRHRSNGHG